MKSKKVGKKIFLVLIALAFLALAVNIAYAKRVSKINLSKVITSSSDSAFHTIGIAHEVIFKSGWSIEGEGGILFLSKQGGATLIPSLTVKKYIESTVPLKFWLGGGIGVMFEGFFFSASVGSKWLLGKAITIEPFLRLNYYALMLPLEMLPHGLGFSLGLGIGIR